MPDSRFVSLKVWQVTLPFRLTFSHNLATRDGTDTLIVEITTANGVTGYGQALPRPYLTGETMETAAENIHNHWQQLSKTVFPSFADFGQAMEAMTPFFEDADRRRLNASYAALDVAALDAIARTNGIPAHYEPASRNSRIELVAAIPATSPGKASRLARILKWLGYRRFKVKVGKDAQADDKRLDSVRRAIGSEAWLAVDANQAWESGEAVERMRGLAKFNVRLVEEPLAGQAARTADFSALEKETGVATMADESLCTMADAGSLLDRGSASWWNIRLAKNGGLTGAHHFYRLANKHNIKIYGGILVGETSLLAAASRHSLSGCVPECAEYGFPRIFLRGDFFRGGPAGYRGYLSPPPPESHGLGISIKCNILRRNGRLLYELS